MPDNLKRKTKKGLYWTAINNFANYGIQFIIGIVMARLLSPDDYGIAALPGVFMALAGVFIDSGFSGAMVRKPDLTEEDLSTAFYYSIGIGVVCYVILFAISPFVADFYNVPLLENLMRVTALSFLINPLNSPQRIILSRRLDFKTPAKVSVITKIIMGVVGITIAYMGFGVWALVLSSLFSNILSLALNWYIVKWYPKTGWNKASFHYLWGYGNKLMASYLLGNLYENIVPVFVGKYYSPTQLGVYNRAEGYGRLLSANATGILQGVTFPVLSKMQDDKEFLRHSYRKILRVSAFVIFPLMMMLAALARPLIIVMITEKWEASIILLQLMCFPMMWYPIHAINLNLLQVMGRTDYFFRLEIIKKAYGLVALAISLPISLVAVVLSQWVTNVFSLIVNTYYTQKIINVGFVRQMRDLMPTFLLSLFMFGSIHLVNIYIDNYICQIVIGGIVGVVVYISGALFMHFPELEDVRYMLSRR